MNLLDAFSKINDYYAPKIIGSVNETYVKIVKIKGNKIPLHTHVDNDELFYIIDGDLQMEQENQGKFTLQKGELYIVPRGVKHRVSSQVECKILLIEGKTTRHTGDVSSEITRTINDQLS